MRAPRVAFFTDSFLEVNGVARTSREFARYAREKNHPFFSVHTGPQTRCWREGSVITQELKHSRFVVPLETDLAFDLLFIRHRSRLLRQLRDFRPDLLHVTGPGHIGILGAILARQLNIPLVGSWHTNVHEFGARRLQKILRFAPAAFRIWVGQFTEAVTLQSVIWFYKLARLVFAPNPELVAMLAERAHRPAYLMKRGIDLSLFSPRRRKRLGGDFTIGYVGRLSPEKNVRLLVDLEQQLVARGIGNNYRFHVIGDGGDRQWLSEHLQRADLPGILLGDALADAYANMDVFVFPSETDTFGNVVLEAMASGLPALVSSGGGPKYIIRSGIDGFAAEGSAAFADRLLELYDDPDLLTRMSENARTGAFEYSWDAVFNGIYYRYQEVLSAPQKAATTEQKLAAAHVLSGSFLR